MLKKFMKSKKGFTLVELMVVVVIIGILVAIAVPVYNAVTQNAEDAADDANIRILNSAVMQYSTVSGNALTDITDGATITNVAGVATPSDATIANALVGNYIAALPLPSTGTTYTYDSGTGIWSR